MEYRKGRFKLDIDFDLKAWGIAVGVVYDHDLREFALTLGLGPVVAGLEIDTW